MARLLELRLGSVARASGWRGVGVCLLPLLMALSLVLDLGCSASGPGGGPDGNGDGGSVTPLPPDGLGEEPPPTVNPPDPETPGGEVPPEGETVGCGELLAEEPDAQLWGVSDDGLGIVFERREGTRPFVLKHLPSGTTTETQGRFVAFSRDGTRAFFHDPNVDFPRGELFELRLDSGARSVLLEGTFQQVFMANEGRALVATGPDGIAVVDADSRAVRDFPQTRIDGFENPGLATKALLLEATDGVVLVGLAPGQTQRLTDVQRSFGLVGASGNLIYWNTAGALRGVTPDGRAVTLGTFASEPFEPFEGRGGKDAVLVVDESGTARAWRYAESAVRELGTGVTFARLSEDETAAIVVSRDEANPAQFVLAVVDIMSGQRVTVVTSAAPMTGVRSGDGARLAIIERLPVDEGQVARSRLRLWNLLRNQEIPLQPPADSVPEPISLVFRHGERVLQGFFWNEREVLYSADTGALLYDSPRSVVPEEGAFSFWDTDESSFFSPAGGYGGAPASLYVWSIERAREDFLGPRAGLMCFTGEHALFRRNIGDPTSTKEGVSELLSWSSETGVIQQLAASADVPSCVDTRGGLFRDGLPAGSANSPEVTGRLVWAPDGGAAGTRPIDDNVRSYRAAAEHVYYSKPGSLCRTRLEATRNAGRPSPAP